MISGPIARILLRVIAGILMGYMTSDVLDNLISDPDIETLMTTLVDASIGAALWAATEVYYGMAKRFGWRT